MNDQKIRNLLHEVADDVEPRDRLDAIRAATAPARRRTHRGWWAAGGAGLVAASVVTALALTGGAPQSADPGPADGPTSGTTASEGPVTDGPVAVYFVGDTAEGPRLFREFRPDFPSDDAVWAIDAAVAGEARDPDYRSPWPEGVTLSRWIPGPDTVQVILTGAPVERPQGMSEQEAQLALEQLVRTAQAANGDGPVPVDVQVEGRVTDTILGVPTVAPLPGSPDLDVLAPVSLSDPSEGLKVDNDNPFTLRGRGTSADGTVSIEVKRWEGTGVVASRTVRGAVGPDRFSAFAETFDLSDVPPGDYDVIVTVQDAGGTVAADTRRITVVD